jgi:hypothetical protein
MSTQTRSAARRPTRVLVTLAASLALVGLLAGPAMAGRYVDRAASALLRDPVYVDSAARLAMPPASASAVRQRIRHASTPVYVAVLPAAALREANNDPNQLARAIASALARLGRPATVAVAVGNRTGAHSNTLDPDGTVAAIRAASSAHHDNLQATMVDFVNRVGAVGALGGRGGEVGTPLWDRPLVRPIPFVLGALILAPWWIWIFLNVLRRRRRGRGAAI